jgi:hypothetical protein
MPLTPLVKVSRDAQGNPKPYPPTFKLALRGKKGAQAGPTAGTFETDFYNAGEKDVKGLPTKFAPELALDEVLVKRAQVTAIIQCTGVWFAGGKFGTTWKAVQLRVDSQPEQIRGPAFRSDAPDIRAFVSKKLAAAAAPAEEEDAEEEEAEEVVAAVLPKKVVKAAPAPAPAPAPAAFEEEAVAEPVPVPKKVVKKVVSKVAAK